MNPALPKHIMVICKNITNLMIKKSWCKNNKSQIQGGGAG